MQKARTVDAYLESAGHWRSMLETLRELLHASELEETVKWGAPCYTLEGKNVIGLVAFKGWVALWFHQGALLADPDSVLVNAQEGRTRALRQWRFRSHGEIDPQRVSAYIHEAVALQRAGVPKLPPGPQPTELPEELENLLAEDGRARACFEGLTPGRQREYARHIGEAKRADTRRRRLEKALPALLAGRGLNDRYRDC